MLNGRFPRCAVITSLIIGIGGAAIPRPTHAQSEDFGALRAAAIANSEAERWAQAADLWEKVAAMNPVDGENWTELARARFAAGDYRGAITAFEREFELGARIPFDPLFDIARAYGLLGERATSLDWLARSFDAGLRHFRRSRTDPAFESFRGDPRYRALVGLVDTDTMSRDDGWLYNLRTLAAEIDRMHYDPYRVTPKAEFDGYVDELRRTIPNLTDHEVEVGLMRLARMVGDAHTNVRPSYTLWDTREVTPVRFYLFGEGLFLTSAAPEYGDLVGAQVLRIGDRSVDETIEALADVISRDNEMWIKFEAPALISYPQILNGLGLIPDPAALPITVRDVRGVTRTATLSVRQGPGQRDSISVWKQRPLQLYLRDRDSNYWYDSIFNDSDESIEDFTSRLFRFIDESDAERLVIDMRWNGGGNLFLNKTLIHSLIRSRQIDRTGHLFVIIGRNTFSAAMHGAAQIALHTEAMFVGEPTGSPPNFVGETVFVSLPYRNMFASISNLYWQGTHAADFRSWIAPTLYAPPSFQSLRQHRDPAMDAIEAYVGWLEAEREP